MNDTPATRPDALDATLFAATDRIRPDLLLLSGGVDSSLLSALWREHGHRPRCITVGLDPAVRCEQHAHLPYPCNSDLAWAERLASALDLDWTPLALSIDAALAALGWLIVHQRSFDLGQLNNIALIAGIQHVGDATIVATGDDGDGLFGGYRFAADVPDWGSYVRERIPHIDPPVRRIASDAGTQAVFPYLEPEVLEIVHQLTSAEIREQRPAGPLPPAFMDQFDPDLMASASAPWGKAILRHVAERHLPAEFAWRPKTDLQFGSGMCALESVLAEHAQDVHAPETIRFFNDAHRGMYSRFIALGQTPPPVRDGEYACVSCGGGVPIGKRHCVTCGCWPADT